MTIFRDLSVLWSLFHILILFIMLYRSRYGRRKTIFLTVITMGPIIILNIAGLILYGAEAMGQAFILTCTLPSLIVFWIISIDKKGRFFFTFCFADTIALWIIVVTNLLDFYFGGGQYVLMFIGRLLLFPLVEWWAIRYLRKPYLELQESVAEGWGIFAGMMALYYILLVVKANFPVIITARPQEVPSFILILLLMPMTYATIFTALYRQLLLYRKQQSERVLSEQKLLLEARLENRERIRKMKHDMKGHTVTLSGLLATGKIKEALEYLKGVETELSTLSGQFCANPYLALKELVQEKRAVLLQMKYNGNYLLMRLRNRCREDFYVEKGTLPGTDKEGQDHGFGLLTIQEAVQRLDGEMFCYTENENFVLDVMLSRESFSKGLMQG